MENNYIILYKWEGRIESHNEEVMFAYCEESDLLKKIKEIQYIGNVIVSVNLISK